MKIKLKRLFAANNSVDEFDVLQMKKVLNRLGYYQPLEQTGITGMADKAVFDALKEFQKDHGLSQNAVIKPEDGTEAALNHELEKTPAGYYIWRTAEDDKVRQEHLSLNRAVRSWANDPDPGEDHNCRCWAEFLSNSAADRRQALLGNGLADFRLRPDLKPIDEEPYYALSAFSEVSDNEKIIAEEAGKAKINADLVRAIIYVETTQGWYDRFHPWNKSIRPMNIQAEYWKDLGYTRGELEIPRYNIRTGVDLIRRLQLQVPSATIDEIATLYNGLNAKRVNDYGARIARVMQEKPWQKKR